MTMRHSTPIGLTMSLGVAGIALGQSTAVQWRVEDGGNGHWYSAVSVPAGITWEDARERAASQGGQLACLETAEEASFCFTRFSRDNVPAAWTSQGSSFIFGPWIGGYQLPGGQEPNGGWLWVSGSAFDPTSPACCNNSCGGSSNENRLHLYHSGGTTWNDLPSVVTCGNQIRGFVIEWSEDCNGDALVDYGQITSGTLSDMDSDGVPDACESGFAASTSGYGAVPTVPVREFDLAEGIAVGIIPGGSLIRWGPVTASPPAGIFVSVSAGNSCAIAIRSDGVLVGFGANTNGQLNVPTGTFRKITAADASWHAAGIRTDGTVACWGHNNHGQANAPGGTFLDIAAGGHQSWSGFTVAVRSDGSLAAWGNNTWGQRNVPVGNLFMKLAAGYYHALAIRVDGTLAGWGWNANGQVSVPGGSFVDIACGSNESVALRADGTAVPFGAVPASVSGFFTGKRWVRVQLTCCEGAAGVEFRDCDGDGIGDATVITLDPSEDVDSDAIPDSCECPADLDRSGTIDAEDLAFVLFAWGTDGGKTPDADITRDGNVDANDLSVVLGSWGSCPN